MDVEQGIQENCLNSNHVQDTNQDEEGQGNQVTLSQIHYSFSYPNLELITLLDGMIMGVLKTL